MGPNRAQANIKAVITAEDRASKTLQNFGNEGSKMGAKLKAGLLVAGTAAVGFAVASVKAFSESQNVIAQTNAVIKSTGGVAGVTAKEVSKLASSLQSVTKFSDETIQGGQNLLLTFTKIGADIFPQATETMLNMSQALGQDVSSSAIQLGKALQDPILGITALRRVGVNFNDAQKEVVKRLVETGQHSKAQALILKELQIEFGNSARAAGETFAGRLTILKNRFNDVQETIGMFIVNGLFSLTNSLFSAFGSIQRVASLISGFFRPSFEALINTFVTRLLPSLRSLNAALQPALTRVLSIVAKIIGATLIAAIWTFINALNVAVRVISTLITWIARIIGWFGNMAGAGVNAARSIGSTFSGLISIVRSVANAIRNVIELAGRAKNAVGKLNPVSGAKSLLNKLPGFQHGTSFAPGGMAVVGERGPELVNLPRGSQVIPNNRVGGSVNITIQAGAFMGSQTEARKFAKMIMDAYNDLQAAKGLA